MHPTPGPLRGRSEGRDQHAPVTEGYEFGHTGLGLALEEGDRVRALRAGVELSVGRARDPSAQGLAARNPLGDSGVLDATVPSARRQLTGHSSPFEI
jgi:hypothetical protein